MYLHALDVRRIVKALESANQRRVYYTLIWFRFQNLIACSQPYRMRFTRRYVITLFIP